MTNMLWNIAKVFVVLLPLGIISGIFGYWFDQWLEKKYPNMNQAKQERMGTAAMLGLATILTIGFFIVVNVFA